MKKRIVEAGVTFNPQTPPQVRMLRRYGYGNNSAGLFPGASQDFTLVARIMLTNNVAFGDTFVIHMSSADTGPNRLFFYFTPTGTISALAVVNSAGSTQLFSSGTQPAGTYPRGQWYTLAARRIGATWTYFINGTQIATATQTGTWNPSGEANKYLRFSGRTETTPQQFAIKYATVHFRGLTNSEISTNYGTTLSPTVPSGSLVGHWIFDNIVGNNIPDLSGNSYTLAPVTFPVAAGSAPVTPAINTADYWANLNDQAMSVWEGVHTISSTASATLPYTATFTAPSDCVLRRLVILANRGSGGANAGISYEPWTSSSISLGHYRINGGSLIDVSSDTTVLQGYASARIDANVLAGQSIEWILPTGFQSAGTTPFIISYGMGLGLLLTS